jgi:hypothetical protein
MNEKNSGLRILVAIRFAPSIPYIDVTGFKFRLGRCLHDSQPTGQSKILRLIISMFCDRVNHMHGLRTCVFCGFSGAGQSRRLDISGSWFGGHLVLTYSLSAPTAPRAIFSYFLRSHLDISRGAWHIPIHLMRTLLIRCWPGDGLSSPRVICDD